jgi:tetratricopeptide (TPR) repeat protein
MKPGTVGGNGYDVFFCYSWKDKREADSLVAALKEEQINGRRLRVFQDDKEMNDFDLITPQVEAALAKSRCLVVLYSENLLASAYCRFELRTALSAGHHLDRSPQRVMAILRNMRYEDVRPGRLAALRLPDPRTATREHLVASVVARVRQTDERTFGHAPSAPPPVWHPSPLAGTAQFYGRDIELWEIYDALHAHRDPGIGGASVARIVGLGGLGKTMLAEQYARQFAADYPGGIFVLRGFGSHLADRADRHYVRARREDQAAGFARELRIEVSDPAATERALSEHLTEAGLPYLWIIDDLPAALDRETFMSLLAPTADGQTLVTTRYLPKDYGLPWGAEVRLRELDPGGAVSLLTSRQSASDVCERRSAVALAERLGRLPLALTVAASLAAQPDLGGFAGLLRAIEQPGPDVLELGEQLWGELPTGHRASIAATMLRSVDRMSDVGREVLRVASLLAPTPIPRPLVEGVLAQVDGEDELTTRNRVMEGFADAVAHCLASELPADGAAVFTVHTMVSRTLRFADLDFHRRGRLQIGAVEELTSRLESSKAEFVHGALADYLPHVDEVAAGLAGEDEWHLVNEAGRVQVELGDLRRALTCYEHLFETCLSRLGPEHDTTLTVLAGLGAAHGLIGDYAAALTFKQRAHEGLATARGRDDPDVLTAYNNLAVSHSELGDHVTARRIYGEVFRARRRVLNVQHPDTLAALSNYAIAVGQCGEHKLAYRLKRSVYQRSQTIHGENHPVTLDALNNLAASAFALGEERVAHDMLCQVYRARRQILGAGHVDTLTAQENMAGTSVSRDSAVTEFRTVYMLRLSVLGPTHPHTRRVLRWLLEWTLPHEVVASARRRVDEQDEDADILIATLLAIDLEEVRRRELGPDAPETLLAICYLAHALAMQGPGMGARPLIDAAAEGLSEHLGTSDLSARSAHILLGWIDTFDDPPVTDAEEVSPYT